MFEKIWNYLQIYHFQKELFTIDLLNLDWRNMIWSLALGLWFPSTNIARGVQHQSPFELVNYIYGLIWHLLTQLPVDLSSSCKQNWKKIERRVVDVNSSGRHSKYTMLLERWTDERNQKKLPVFICDGTGTHQFLSHQLFGWEEG